MTSETITIRLRRSKAELQSRAKPNLNAWINDLIDQALEPRKINWNEHIDKPSSRRRFKYQADALRKLNR